MYVAVTWRTSVQNLKSLALVIDRYFKGDEEVKWVT